MLSSRAVLLVGALSVALLMALAALGLHLTTGSLTPVTAQASVYAPDYLTLVENLDAVPVAEATDRFLAAVQQQYPTPESPTIDEVLAPAAVDLAARLNAVQDTLGLVLSTPSAMVAQARAELIQVFFESAGLHPDLLHVEAVAGPPSLARRVADSTAVVAS